MSHAKPEVISFKADQALLAAMEGIPNRSEFIRNAILAALDGVCPLCQGTGILSPQQKNHWQSFARHHQVRRCDACQALHLVCAGHGDGHGESEVHE
ncbi:MAG: CopG family transcriptional regulator [Desulfarculus sp.]|nr:CopG family transcriptional regulator [Desulfarculus sp.]